MNKNVRVAVYGFTAHQSVLLSPFIRKLWNVSKITRITENSEIEKTFSDVDLLVVNGCLDFFELEFILSLVKSRKDLSLACLAFEKLSKAGYDTICRHNVPVVIAGLSEENDISLCREKIEKTGTVKIGEPSNDTVESTYQEDFEKLSPKERCVMVCMLKGMKQESIAREFGISPSTVGTYFSRIYRKCDVCSRNELYQKFAI